MTLKIINQKTKSTTVESHVSYILNDYIDGSTRSLYSLNDSFKEWLESIPKVNSYPAHFFYKIIPNEKFTAAEVWHLNAHGDPDRKIAEIISVESN